MLRTLQINLHRSKAASAGLLVTLGEGHYDLVLIQEPWVSSAGEVNGLALKGFKLFTANEEGRKRSAILARTNLNLQLCSHYSTNDLTVVLHENVDTRSKTLIASVYMAHDRQAPPEEVQQLVGEARKKGSNLVIGGDFNAHHEIWGSKDTNDRGESIYLFLLSTNLVIGNRGEEPTYVGPTSENVLDVTVHTDCNNCALTDWRVLDEISLSDHKYISFNISLKTEVRKIANRNAKNTDWTKYERLVRSELENKKVEQIWNVPQLERTVRSVTNTLNKAFKKSCPLSWRGSKSQPPWWSNDLRMERERTQTLFKRARSTNNQSDWLEYKEALKSFKKKLRTAKRSSWKSFCEQIEDTSEAARLRRVLSKKHSQQGSIRKADGSWTEGSAETVEVLLETHFPGCTQATQDHPEEEGIRISPSRVPAGLVSERTIAWALKTFDPYKSPGPDGVIPAMLQKASEVITPWLVEIFKACLKLNHVPKAWNEARVVFIPKAGKQGHSKANDYRPISLTSFLLKTLERLLDFHIRKQLEPAFFSKAQHAYMKGKSTSTALHEVVFEIEKSLQYKEYLLAIFLDIEGAFNNVTTEAILAALEKADIDSTIRNWIGKLLTRRTVTAEWGGTRVRKAVHRGTPQGGVLSPLLWALVINVILETLGIRGFKVVAYADDVVILTSGRCLSTISDLTNEALKLLSKWANESGLKINPQKTEAVLFSRRYKIPSFRMPSIEGTQLTLKTEARYLGLILDNKLTWKPNVEDRVAKANKALFACCKLFGRKWGLNPRITHWIYTAIVRPILTYGAMVWWPVVDKSTYLRRLESTQRLAGIGATGALKSTASMALNVVLHLPPIDLFMKQVAVLELVRTREAGLLKQRIYGHSRLVSQVTDSTDYIKPVNTFDKKFGVIIPDRQSWTTGEPDRVEHTSFYTDGSKQESGVGAGVFSEELDIKEYFRLPDHCSIFQAEITAIQKAAELACINVPPGRRITIYVDSQAALKALDSYTVKSKTVLECLNALQTLSTGRSVKLFWVPGHRDIPGNETADTLAKRGALLEHPNLAIPPSMQLIKHNIGKDTWVKARERWSNTRGCIITKALWTTFDPKRTNIILNLNRRQCSTVVGVYTGHCLIGHFAFKLGIRDSALCRHCQLQGVTETIEHVLCNCPALARHRLSILGSTDLKDLKDASNLKIGSVLNFVNRTGIAKSFQTDASSG